MTKKVDGVCVRLQRKDRKRSRQGKAEVKVEITYDGWKQASKGRYELSDKVFVAGFEGAKDSTNTVRRQSPGNTTWMK